MKTLIALLALLVAAGADAAEKPITSQATGTWSCVTATINGKPLGETTTKRLHLTMTDTRYKTERITERTNTVLFDSTYRLDTTKAPVHINMVGTEGELTGKEAQGILAVEGDTLKICYTMPGKPRPTRFASTTNSEAYLMLWKRDKK